MELKIEIAFNEILKLVNQLPPYQLQKLKRVLDDKVEPECSKNEDTPPLQKLLLEGPVMSDEEYKVFLENRKMFNSWRVK